MEGETVQQIYQRMDDGSEPGRAELRPLTPIRQKAGEVIIIPVGALHAITARTENWSVVIRSREMETSWRNWYDAEAGTVEKNFLATVKKKRREGPHSAGIPIAAA